MDKIYCNVSSFNRKKTLIKTIESIYDQCDVINVALNNYDEIPQELYDNKINIFITNNEKGDAYKFIDLTNSNGYFFTMDDDLVYCQDYVKNMVDNVEKYGRKNIITLHGRSFKKFPIRSYYNDTTKVYHFSNQLDKDLNVNVGGTGVMAFHTELFKVDINFFEKPNMADIWIAAIAKKKSIPITCVKHTSKDVIQQDISESIYSIHQKNDLIQTQVLNYIFDSKINLEDLKNLKIFEQTTNTPITPPHEQVKIIKTLEKTQKQINYEKINSIFNFNNPNIVSKEKQEKQIINLKLNTSIHSKMFPKNKKR